MADPSFPLKKSKTKIKEDLRCRFCWELMDLKRAYKLAEGSKRRQVFFSICMKLKLKNNVPRLLSESVNGLPFLVLRSELD